MKIEMPQVDLTLCNGCGLCVTTCHCGAIIFREGVITIIETESCGWCTVCEAVCPADAISCAYEIIIED